jgi:predicted phage terminase large subunit-like protein
MLEGLSFVDRLLALDFRSFMMRVFQTVSPADEFEANWHQEAIAWALEEIEFGLNRRLIVNVPPRSLKSIIISIAWVAWLLGQDPRLRIVCISYAGELSAKFARDCRNVMESAWYRRVFPGTRLSGRRAEHDFETTAGGGRFSTSIDGTLTGRGGDILIIDDPMKPADAYSDVVRKRVLEFFKGTALSRLNNKKTGSIVVVMQRLHEEDLCGHLLEAGGWKHLCLPARTGEDLDVQIGPEQWFRWEAETLLHADREDDEFLEKEKRLMGSADFSAQYLQQPIPAGGVMAKRDWLKTYENAPDWQSGDLIVQAWDTASKDGVLNDYSVCITALARRNSVFVLDVFRAKLEFPALKAHAIRLAQLWNAGALLIEDAASGTQLLQALRRDEPAGVCTPIGLRPEGDKVNRFWGQTGRIEAGDLLLPTEAPWLDLFLHEILGFPQARHDDQADALAHLLGWLSKREEPIEDDPGPILYDGETDTCSEGDNWTSDPSDGDYSDPWDD